MDQKTIDALTAEGIRQDQQTIADLRARIAELEAAATAAQPASAADELKSLVGFLRIQAMHSEAFHGDSEDVQAMRKWANMVEKLLAAPAAGATGEA
jgi:hypothetical protein